MFKDNISKGNKTRTAIMHKLSKSEKWIEIYTCNT